VSASCIFFVRGLQQVDRPRCFGGAVTLNSGCGVQVTEEVRQ
jgi:hypothetical protein